MKDALSKFNQLRKELQQLKENKILEVGCIVITNGGEQHRIAEIGYGNSEGVAENCFYHWDKYFPFDIEHAAMNPDTDTIVDVIWPNKD